MTISSITHGTIARAALALVLVSAAPAVAAAAQGKSGCPPIIASLLPKAGAIRGGDYNAAGPMGMGSGYRSSE